MLSNLQSGMETARVAWSRLPNADDAEVQEAGSSSDPAGGGPESLDYEIIENYAYREAQVGQGPDMLIG